MHEFIAYLCQEGYSLEEAKEFISYLDEKILGDPWNWFPKKPQPQQGLPKTGPSSRLPNRVLPPAGMTSASRTQGSSVKASKPTVAKPTVAKPNVYRPGATIRATGPNLNKFPELQRFANQGVRIAKPIAKAAGALTALRNITPAGVAAAVMAPRPTANATLTGALKRGDYKPQQGPKNPDQGLTKTQSFDKAFKAARTAGKSGFVWNNKTYTTKLKNENVMYNEYNIVLNCLVESGVVSSYEDAEKFYIGMSDEWVNQLVEQLTTQTQIRPMQSSGSTGTTRPPAAPVLPKPTSAVKPKPKPEPKVGAGTPGYKYGALEQVETPNQQIDEIAPLVAGGLALGGAALAGMAIKRAQDAAKSGVDAAKKGQKVKPGTGIGNAAYGLQRHSDALKAAMQNNSFELEGEVIGETTKLFYKLQAKGKRSSSTARAQLTSDADLETQKNLKMKKQRQKQMRDREDDDDPRDHGSMSAAERNPSMR